MSAPPVYTNDAPPSYEEVVGKLNTLIGNNRTATGVLEAGSGLTDEELGVLIENHYDHLPLESDAQKLSFAIGTAETSSSPELATFLTTSASAAAATVIGVKNRFDGLQYKLAQVDRAFGTSFQGRFNTIHSSFQGVIDDSQRLSTTMYTNSRKFDNQDILYCDDSTKSVSDRITRINATITKTEELNQDSISIDSRLGGVLSSLNEITDDFVEWARNREGELTEEIRNIKAELISLERELANAKVAAEAVTSVGEGLVPIVGALAAAFPPYGTAIAIGGLIIAGAQLATTTALMVKIGKLENQITEKTNRKEELEAELEQVREARERLEDGETDSINMLGSSINLMSRLSSPTLDDANAILKWLQDGAKADDKPRYMGLNRTNSVKSYAAAGDYLRQFGRGVASICTNPIEAEDVE
ncbi:hypothetical protein ASPZODRAFT_19236 [Penicilliopsis zonata CBS 506.65]|uniref:Alpha-xenorhabdolysin family binary toxin subunit A n=1 Tax=Penicilliopsis zonata CBS 506.65 TaxID=1073090 RepID=A0A1L9S8M3_9EURO|nr:hypothetical protein ASPZODRAFT_19236 [Penicilliopsis zonata CBS 506.65]OJJ43513.1 hypothetical protein ASPZODRAFT_19236 [Penicilliopsis zonata CBS 506.65]